uniref:Uncharacterized protein n=1 Tax=Anguilla anguilla TaxID=7936 RepID=A0A0E9QW27_ANGAN
MYVNCVYFRVTWQLLVSLQCRTVPRHHNFRKSHFQNNLRFLSRQQN